MSNATRTTTGVPSDDGEGEVLPAELAGTRFEAGMGAAAGRPCPQRGRLSDRGGRWGGADVRGC